MGDKKSVGAGDEVSNIDWQPLDKKFATLAVHAGYNRENKNLSSIVSPIVVSASYELDAPAVNRGFEYARTNNLCRKILEEKLAALEGAKHAICFSSGMAAISGAFFLLKNGDHIVVSDDVFGGTVGQLRESVTWIGIEVDYVNFEDFDAYKAAFKPNTKMVFLESPANPTLRIFDMKKLSSIAHEYNKDITVVIDNTCLTSYFQKPLAFGIDLVHYSLTKYANGHGDCLMGALVTNSDSVRDRLKRYQIVYGGIPSPFDCYLVTRGLKTLPLRMKAIMESSLKVAEYLYQHPKIEAVFHPALPSHSGHILAKKQSSGHSGLMSFRITEVGSSVVFLDNLKLIQNAGSFGGCESVAELPAFFTHKSVPEETRLKLGITNNFVRFSVGLEATEDLIDDLSQALDKC